jgi:hypothetical protein
VVCVERERERNFQAYGDSGGWCEIEARDCARRERWQQRWEELGRRRRLQEEAALSPAKNRSWALFQSPEVLFLIK